METLYKLDAGGKEQIKEVIETEGGKVSEGQRHYLLTRQAGKFLQAGIGLEALTTELLRLNKEKCEPPKSEAIIRKLALDLFERYKTNPEAVLILGKSTKQTPAATGIELVRYSTIKPERVRWQWKRKTANGKITSLNGDPGGGKSLISIDIAARVTTGRPWPDQSVNILPPCDVILLTEEEDKEDTILPRFLAAGGDASRLIHLQMGDGELAFHIERDLVNLEEKIRSSGANVKLVIFDPMIDFTKAKRNVEEEVRPVLVRLKRWAKAMDLAVIGINHLNKKSDAAAIDRVGGAKGWVGTPRFNFIVIKGDDGDIRHMIPLKVNIGPEGQSLDFYIEEVELEGYPDLDPQPRIKWLGAGEAKRNSCSPLGATIRPTP